MLEKIKTFSVCIIYTYKSRDHVKQISEGLTLVKQQMSQNSLIIMGEGMSKGNTC